MDDRDAILNYLKMNGPSLPVQIGRYMKKEILMTSAILSELSSSKKIKLSNLKVGQSKLYYVPGQEEHLQKFSDYLGEKDKRTYNLLKENIILREKDIDPLTRVSLRQIKDFAVPLEVNINGEKELFWRWYLTGSEETEERIRNILGIGKEESKEKEELSESKKEVLESKEESLKEEVLKEEVSKEEVSKEEISKNKLKSENEKDSDSFDELTTEKDSNFIEIQNRIPVNMDDDFGKQVISYFDKKGIKALNYDIIQKNRDIDFEILLPSPAGDLLYYCKARNKSKINDGDIASSFVTGQLKHLPILYLTTGGLLKKTEDKLKSDFRSVKVVFFGS